MENIKEENLQVNISKEKQITEQIKKEQMLENNRKDQKPEKDVTNTQEQKDDINKYLWALNIPSISLLAEIEEGTDAETLNRNIGHFSDTNLEKGNIGLAAHNRRI